MSVKLHHTKTNKTIEQILDVSDGRQLAFRNSYFSRQLTC
jgi:hypothetical protein